MSDRDPHNDDEQDRAWEELYGSLGLLLRGYGNEGWRDADDFMIDGDDLGTLQQKVYVRNLRLLQPDVIGSMQRLVEHYPGWEIMVAVSVPGPGDAWPDMGLTIRAHEIVDGLQRQYFPKEFQDIRYEGSRPGTEND
jgi:hypothetical protein